jgi:sugar phosphate permease
MRAILWVLTILGSLIGGLIFFLGFTSAKGAPQEAAAAAAGIAFGVLPYVCARAVDELKKL